MTASRSKSDQLIPPRGWAWALVDGVDAADLTAGLADLSQSISSEDATPAAVASAWPLCNDTQLPNIDNCVQPLTISAPWPTRPVIGIVSPVVIVFTAVTNCLVCVVLLRPHMRTATNALLVAMALSDMMTGLWPLPVYINFYTLGRHVDYVPYSWCFAYHCLNDYLPTIFHTASIWLTVGLAVHRYICVCHSVLAKKLCTISNVVRAIIVVFAAAFVSQLTRFVEQRYAPVLLSSMLNDIDPDDDASAAATTISSAIGSYSTPLTSLADEQFPVSTTTAESGGGDDFTGERHPLLAVVGCAVSQADFVAENTQVYFNVYYWFRVVFMNLAPCSALIVLNALLVRTMRTAQARRRQLLAQNRKSECRRLAESNMTTLMLVAVVGVFLLVEFPLALMLILLIVDNTWGLELIDANTQWIAPLWLNLFILLSYPLNFFIYCAMSRQFRETFRSLCCGRSETESNAEQQTVYVTVAGGGGGEVLKLDSAVNGTNRAERKTSRV